MGKKVSNLKIQLQPGTDNTFYASWTFNESQNTTSSNIKVGSLVSIKSGSTWYNGVAISSWVFNHKWYVSQVSGDRAVIDKNESGTNSIKSPINTKNLIGGSSSSSSSSVDSGTLDHYELKWYYDPGNGVWFLGTTGQTTEKLHTYNPPENCVRFKAVVTPVAKTKQENNESVALWTGDATTVIYDMDSAPPEKPPNPTIELDKYVLTASVENITDARSDKIDFQLYNATGIVTKSRIVDVLACRASCQFTVSPGEEYRVRCRSVNIDSTRKVYSEYTDLSNTVYTIPNAIANPPVATATSDTSIRVEWDEITTATSYDLEHTTNVNYFDLTDKTTVVSNIPLNKRELIGLEAGQEYFFRVRAVNDKGSSAWSSISSVVIGKSPAAPTTWSSSTTVVTGESLTLYWVHNAQDGSSQTYADLELIIDGKTQLLEPIKNSTDEDEKDKTSSYVIDTTEYPEGTTILWRVRTMGVTMEYGDWSVQRSIDIYAQPTLVLKVINASGTPLGTIETFPFYISALAGPNTQAPTGYHLSITSNEVYTTTDKIGNIVSVNEGESVYSKYFDTDDALMVELSPSNVDLENNRSYTVTCTVSMNSGLSVTESTTFDVSWTETLYEPDMAIGIDRDSYTANIRPYCVDEDGNYIEGVKLAVYRREYDGRFIEIASGIDNLANTTVIDPHPSLDYARYRVVATDIATGAVSYYDPPGYPVGGKAVTIQWAEAWQSFDVTNEDAMERPPWSGSMLILPYDIDVSDSYQTDVELVEYIGRARPVTYYGTQLGEGSNWSMSVPKEDKETIYALRRLAKWTGDVYVREPSGSGYWANISISYSIKHNDPKVPVTMTVTRVEGGI